ncbi:hypothetical protein T06_16999, partial [Trichinella sp. T6]
MHDADLKSFINSAYLDKEVSSNEINQIVIKKIEYQRQTEYISDRDDVYNAMYREICFNSILWKIYGPMQK